MNSLYKVFNNLNKFYTEINPATLTGAIDVVVVEQEDGSLHCSPFHVRFGKLGVLRSREKVVDIEVNGEPVEIHMKLGDSGEAFFVEEIAEDDETCVPENLATSPIPTSQFLYEEEDDEEQQQLKSRKESRAYGAINSALIDELELDRRPRRNSFDLGENANGIVEAQQHVHVDNNEQAVAAAGLVVASGMTKYENQESGFTHRRYTTDSVKRNEMSNEKLLLTKQKIQQEWVGEQVIVQPTATATSTTNSTPSAEKEEEETAAVAEPLDVTEAGSKEDGKSKKKRRKRSIMKKKNSQRKNSSSSSNGSAGSESTILGGDSSSSLPTPSASVKDSDPSVVVVVASGNTTTQDASEGFKPIKPARDMDMHFFSDTEVTTVQQQQGRNNNADRPSTPILSDTEFEMSQRSSHSDAAQAASAETAWKWGELPTPPGETADDATKSAGSQRKSMLTAMFSFMQANRKGDGGLYLSDLDAEGMDPEVAALYFPEQRGKGRGAGGAGIEEEDEDESNGRAIKYQNNSGMMEDDRESGNGTSLPHSPSSVDLGSKMMVDSDLDESRERNLDCIALSTCGGLETGEPTADEFEKYLVTYSEACRNPSIFASPNLVVRLNNKYYTWAAACPIVMTMITFRKPLPQETVEQLVHSDGSNVGSMKGGVAQPGGRGFGWFGWRRSTDKNTTPDKSFGKDRERSEGFSEGTTTESESLDTREGSESATAAAGVPSSEENVHTAAETIDQATAEEQATTPEQEVILKQIKEALDAPKATSKDKYKKTLRLSTDQIQALNLKTGTNEVQFSVTTAYQGTSRCKCYVFLWKYNDKVVISDVDGTITKSDVLGHLMPLVGKDWAQNGVAELYSKIEENGYKMLYLSARAIGQSRTTRDYLRSIRQGDVNLPDGPLLLNPTSLLLAFHREVIEKKPELFKIACLNDIKALFPSNPFYAGYGNRINDAWAYRAVGIPIERIFTINTKGELRHELTQTFQSSYCSLIDIADHLFPPIRENEEDMSKYDEYSNFNFWRDPVCDIPIDDLLLNTSSSVTATKSSSPKAKKESKGDKGGGASSNNTSLTTIPEK